MANVKALRAEILSLEHPVFAVLDGAQFDNLPNALFDGDFVHKPLYLDRGDGNRDQTITAPQLVWLDRDADNTPEEESQPNPDLLDRLLDLIGAKPGAVFWECRTGGEALYRHLRTINMVLVPSEAPMDRGDSYGRSPLQPESEKEAESPAGSNNQYEHVLFRHADSNVMAQVLPVLDVHQFARLFGPAENVMFVPDDDWAIGSPVMVAPRPNDLPPAPSGPLRLHIESLRFVEKQRRGVQAKRVKTHVREHLPPEFAGMSDDQLSGQVDDAMAGASEYGIDQQAALSRWSYMYVLTGGAINNDPQVRKFMLSERFHGSPNVKARQVMDALIYGLRKQAS